MSAYLEINLKIDPKNRSAAAAVYTKYKQPFLTRVKGAQTKQLLLREEDVQVLHGFEKKEDAQAYLKSSLFSEDVVKELKPLLEGEPNIRIYDVAG
jgi:hypothetical protein